MVSPSSLHIDLKKRKSRPDSPIHVTLHLPPTGNKWEWARPLEGSTFDAKRSRGLFSNSSTRNVTPHSEIPSDKTLYVLVTVQCHSWPAAQVIACRKCQQRERSRIGSTAPPNRGLEIDNSTPSDQVDLRTNATSSGKGKMSSASNLEDEPGIVVFKRAPWRVSQNIVNVHLRVTCYSSHHNENEGFEYVESIAHFQMRLMNLHPTIDSHSRCVTRKDASLATAHPFRF